MSKMSVAEYFSFYLHRSGKSHKKIAEALGIKNPNIVSMLKSGRTKIPLGRVAEIAECLDIPKQDFFLRCVAEYDEPLFRTLYRCVPGLLITEKEMSDREAAKRMLADVNRRVELNRQRKLRREAEKRAEQERSARLGQNADTDSSERGKESD
jgi:transcriptional regulator with XRE-family HTH domain